MISQVLLALSLLGQTGLSVDVPDSVQAGSQFVVTLTSIDPSCAGITCSPDCSDGLEYVSSRSMRSYSSSSFNGVATSSQTCTLQLVFLAAQAGEQWIGPFRASLVGVGTASLPAETLTVTGQGSAIRPGQARRLGRRAWIEVTTSGDPFYPGVPFQVDYRLCTSSLVKGVESYWTPPTNGVSSFLDAPESVAWERSSEGIRRGRIISLEVTPAGAGQMMLPVLQAEVSTIAVPFASQGGDITVFSDTLFVTVSAFPDSAMPAGFTGITDSLSFDLEAGEPCRGRDAAVTLTATGPGACRLEEPPSLTVRGPARLLEVAVRDIDEGGRRWDFVLSPDDSGLVRIGPDSVPWLDTGSGLYRMASIPACSVPVTEPVTLCDSAVSPRLGARHRSHMEVLFAAGAALALTAGIVAKWASSRRRTVSTGDASDAEELLTAFEAVISKVLTGRCKPLGPDGIADILEDRNASQMLQRRLVRHWKDLEQMMAGRETRPSDLEKARKTCNEIIDEIASTCQKPRRGSG